MHRRRGKWVGYGSRGGVWVRAICSLGWGGRRMAVPLSQLEPLTADLKPRRRSLTGITGWAGAISSKLSSGISKSRGVGDQDENRYRKAQRSGTHRPEPQNRRAAAIFEPYARAFANARFQDRRARNVSSRRPSAIVRDRHPLQSQDSHGDHGRWTTLERRSQAPAQGRCAEAGGRRQDEGHSAEKRLVDDTVTESV